MITSPLLQIPTFHIGKNRWTLNTLGNLPKCSLNFKKHNFAFTSILYQICLKLGDSWQWVLIRLLVIIYSILVKWNCCNYSRVPNRRVPLIFFFNIFQILYPFLPIKQNKSSYNSFFSPKKFKKRSHLNIYSGLHLSSIFYYTW